MIRGYNGIGGVDKCSTTYRYGGYSSFVLGSGRLAYAGLAKAGSVLASSGASASLFRSSLRRAFGGGNSFRAPDLARYGTDDLLRAASGRTNLFANALGAGAAVTGAINSRDCGCKKK